MYLTEPYRTVPYRTGTYRNTRYRTGTVPYRTVPTKNTRQRETREIPGYAAKLVEDRKFYVDKISERHAAKIHGRRHTLVPFAVEDGGKLGAHAHALLRSLAERAVRQGPRS